MEFFIALAVLLSLIIAIVVIYNAIVSNHQGVIRAWSDVVALEHQKINILPELEKVVSDYSTYEQSLQKQVAEIRSDMSQVSSDNLDQEKVAALDRKVDMTMAKIQATAEDYPELKASDIYQNLMKEMTEQQEGVTAAITVFNYNVERYNISLLVIPNSFVNAVLLHREPITPFQDTEASGGFEYRPDLS